MPTKTHKQVTERFKLELAELCEKYNITITSDSDIRVEIEPVYNTAVNLYTEYGADFNIGTRFDKTTANQIKEKQVKSDWPVHSR